MNNNQSVKINFELNIVCNCLGGEMVDAQDLKSWGHCDRVGSSPIRGTKRFYRLGSPDAPKRAVFLAVMQNKHKGPLAQWLEQLTHNQLVVGSIPTGPTLIKQDWSDSSVG